MSIKSPVSWMGNKTSILHILYALFPLSYGRYIEPFGGSGAVLLGKAVPDKFEVYNGDCEVVIDYLTVAQLTQLADLL